MVIQGAIIFPGVLVARALTAWGVFGSRPSIAVAELSASPTPHTSGR